MKYLRHLFCVLFIMLCIGESYSQVNRRGRGGRGFGQGLTGGISANYSHLLVFDGGPSSYSGFGAQGFYAQSEKLLVLLGFSYYAPATRTRTFTLSPYSSGSTAPDIEVDVEQTVNYYNIRLGLQAYLLGDISSDFGLYGLAGMGAMIQPITTKVGEFDSGVYSMQLDDGDDSNSDMIIFFGVGASVGLGNAFVFPDTYLTLPAAREDKSGVMPVHQFDIDISLASNIGVGITF